MEFMLSSDKRTPIHVDEVNNRSAVHQMLAATKILAPKAWSTAFAKPTLC